MACIKAWVDLMKTEEPKKPRRAGSGKSKGSSFERTICGKLSLWLSRGLRDDLLWRSAMSGGRATVRHKRGLVVRSQHGDISAIQPEGDPLTRRFFIECKAYSKINFHGLYSTNEKPLAGIAYFWVKAVEESAKYNLCPMLIAKENNFPPVVLLNWDGIVFFELEEFYYGEFLHLGGAAVYLVYLDHFLQHARRPRG